jgi:hemin uptake protein HemP
MTELPPRSSPGATRKREASTNNVGADMQCEVDSKQLFADAKELFIRHNGERYTLRRTSKGKLILTK